MEFVSCILLEITKIEIKVRTSFGGYMSCDENGTSHSMDNTF